MFHINRRLLGWSENEIYIDWLYLVICLLLTCMAGLMSGLTLGLMSLDTVDLEVLLRSGTPAEQRYARKIMPLVSNNHLLLVTLLMCNAAAMETLPLFLDKLADPVTAVIVSVTAVLFFGEIIPQSICSRYGLRIGAHMAPLVRLLMWLCSPVAWPIGKLIDLVIGPDHHTLFRRRQLKELVSIHAEDAGMGGALTTDEIKVIIGALDLTNKVAYRAMTPLDKVFMLSSSDLLDEGTLRSILRSGHSRVLVHQEGDRGDVVGLVLVKELLQYRLGSSSSKQVPVAMLRIRSIPRLPATTRMYDMLRLFQTGRSHIAVLTQPPCGELRRLLAMDPSAGNRKADLLSRSRSGRARRETNVSTHVDATAAATQNSSAPPVGSLRTAMPVATACTDDARSVAAETDDGYQPYNLYYMTSGGGDTSYPASALDPQEIAERATATTATDWGVPDTPRGGEYDGCARGGGPPLADTQTAAESAELSSPRPPPRQQLGRMASVFTQPPAAVIAAQVAAVEEEAVPPGLDKTCAAPAAVPHSPWGSPPLFQPGFHRLSRMALIEANSSGSGAVVARAVEAGGERAPEAIAEMEEDKQRRLASTKGHGPVAAAAPNVLDAAGASVRAGGAVPAERGGDDGGGTDEDDFDEPEEGRPIGIITIEDVIEELIRTEIVDETDRYVDNNRLIRANPAQLAKSLPEHLAKVLVAAGASKKAAALQRAWSGGGGHHAGVVGGQGVAPSQRSLTSGMSGFGGSTRDWSRGSTGYLTQHPSQGALRVPLLNGEQFS